MIANMVNSSEFREMMERHLKEMMLYLLESDTPFGLLCNLEYVRFDPPLPPELSEQLNNITLFMIAGYTFESFEIEEHLLSFEAGFGPQNFGSVVSMPTLAVLQVVVEETPILINMALPPAHPAESKEEPGVKSSLEALLSNPENRRFLKEARKEPPESEKRD
ncbi:hypothetical protein [Hydrogenimonas sp.]